MLGKSLTLEEFLARREDLVGRIITRHTGYMEVGVILALIDKEVIRVRGLGVFDEEQGAIVPFSTELGLWEEAEFDPSEILYLPLEDIYVLHESGFDPPFLLIIRPSDTAERIPNILNQVSAGI